MAMMSEEWLSIRISIEDTQRLDTFVALHGQHVLHPLGYLAKDGVFAIQMRLWRMADEELASAGVGTTVGHGQRA